MCCKGKLGGVFTYHVCVYSDLRLSETDISKSEKENEDNWDKCYSLSHKSHEKSSTLRLFGIR